ncbi:anaphase-promoting complex subunit 11 RING-H2 finger-domain-containing protein [Cristinia sonorae]|uniref:Anaphase-promoting complex subunit 11 n=1 Tax=Cristinia sonorae TaxID=1940300 RepID=A0A8K0US27_9AGAR|nr:anaphase-promoting complex subunit 11 RING-H2 finger-domain-containing protein [Cristinia sonorae]
MKVTVKNWHAIAQWRWDIGSNADEDEEGDVCGICRVAYEGCCPTCKMPGDDCPLIWGECTHVFHMHCLLKWIGTASSKQQCPMDRRPWGMSAGLYTHYFADFLSQLRLRERFLRSSQPRIFSFVSLAYPLYYGWIRMKCARLCTEIPSD